MSEKVSGTGGVSLDMPILYLKAQQSGIVCIDQHSTSAPDTPKAHFRFWKEARSHTTSLQRSELWSKVHRRHVIVKLPGPIAKAEKVTLQPNYRRSAWSFGGLIMLNLCKHGPIWYTIAGESTVTGCHAQTIRCIGTSRPETTIKMGCWDADVCYADAKVQPGFPQGLLLAVPISKTTHPKLQTSAILP